MRCSKCGGDVEPGRRFCRFCGAPVGLAWPEDTTEEFFDETPPKNDRRATWAFVAGMVLVVCVAVALVVYFALGGDGDGTTPRTSDAAVSATGGAGDTTASTTGDTGAGTTLPTATASTGALAPADLSSSALITASSTLAQQGTVDYSADNLVDGDPATCWAEGVPGYGVGESVEFAFVSPVTVTQMRIIPGYDKVSGGWDRWTSNGRVRSLRLDFSDGATETISVTDTRDMQVITLASTHSVTSIRVTIIEIYEAAEGPDKAEDTSVSELQFWGAD